MDYNSAKSSAKEMYRTLYVTNNNYNASHGCSTARGEATCNESDCTTPMDNDKNSAHYMRMIRLKKMESDPSKITIDGDRVRTANLNPS